MRGRVVAFFDLDRTLIDVNSAVLYAKFERKYGRISSKQLFMSIFYTILYHFNLIDIEKAYEKATAHYRGVSELEMKERTHEFFMTHVKNRLQPGALEALASHKRQGHLLVLLSTSSCYQAELAAQVWSLDDWIANRFPVSDGVLNGEVHKPLCYGVGKVIWAEKWAELNEADLGACYFYSDSYSDLPMLERVKHPRVVNPDPKLKKYAKSNGWKILDWSTSAKVEKSCSYEN